MTEHTGPAHLSEVGQKCLGLPGVVAADVLEDDSRPGAAVLELTVGPDYDRTPPRVLRTLAENDLGLYSQTPSGDYFKTLAL